MKPKKIGAHGVMNTGSHTGCPNCNTDLGYYGDLIGGFECPECGAAFSIEPEIIYWYQCTKEAGEP